MLDNKNLLLNTSRPLPFIISNNKKALDIAKEIKSLAMNSNSYNNYFVSYYDISDKEKSNLKSILYSEQKDKVDKNNKVIISKQNNNDFYMEMNFNKNCLSRQNKVDLEISKITRYKARKEENNMKLNELKNDKYTNSNENNSNKNCVSIINNSNNDNYFNANKNNMLAAYSNINNCNMPLSYNISKKYIYKKLKSLNNKKQNSLTKQMHDLNNNNNIKSITMNSNLNIIFEYIFADPKSKLNRQPSKLRYAEDSILLEFIKNINSLINKQYNQNNIQNNSETTDILQLGINTVDNVFNNNNVNNLKVKDFLFSQLRNKKILFELKPFRVEINYFTDDNFYKKDIYIPYNYSLMLYLASNNITISLIILHLVTYDDKTKSFEFNKQYLNENKYLELINNLLLNNYNKINKKSSINISQITINSKQKLNNLISFNWIIENKTYDVNIFFPKLIIKLKDLNTKLIKLIPIDIYSYLYSKSFYNWEYNIICCFVEDLKFRNYFISLISKATDALEIQEEYYLDIIEDNFNNSFAVNFNNMQNRLVKVPDDYYLIFFESIKNIESNVFYNVLNLFKGFEYVLEIEDNIHNNKKSNININDNVSIFKKRIDMSLYSSYKIDKLVKAIGNSNFLRRCLRYKKIENSFKEMKTNKQESEYKNNEIENKTLYDIVAKNKNITQEHYKYSELINNSNNTNQLNLSQIDIELDFINDIDDASLKYFKKSNNFDNIDASQNKIKINNIIKSSLSSLRLKKIIINNNIIDEEDYFLSNKLKDFLFNAVEFYEWRNYFSNILLKENLQLHKDSDVNYRDVKKDNKSKSTINIK